MATRPQLLKYRFHHLDLMHQVVAASCQPTFPKFELGHHLPAGVEEDSKIVKIVAPLLRPHEQELAVRRSCDPHVAIVEAVWAAAHTEKEISTDEMAKRVNGLMARRGEILVYNARQIGWKLRTLELHRRSNGKNRVLQFSRDMRRRIHELARQFGLAF